MTTRRRLDAELVRRGLARSRHQALELIDAGRVLVGGAPADKASRQVAAAEPVVVIGPPPPYVSRGGEKLKAALDAFPISPAGLRCLDAGASTGGFTDCLLQAGASEVVAVDVGHGQLDSRIRADARVEVFERTNIRTASLGDIGGRPFPFVVADLSFISLRAVVGRLFGDLALPTAVGILLVKPQFEAGRAEASAGKGVVRNPEVWRRVLGEVRSALQGVPATMMDAMVSPIRGAEGNVEFLVHVSAGARPDLVPVADSKLDEVVAEAAGRTEG
ncbi:MAG: TlyA family RNA methyltransferase [Acidimicrobiales bacterium]